MEEDEGFFDGVAKKVDDFFMPEEYNLETDTGFKRQVMDRRIEGYLDAHFDEYISTYDLVTEIDLQRLENRYEKMEANLGDIKSFALDTDAKVSSMEDRVETIKKETKGKSK
jgi:hypothetical protein